MLTQTKKRGRPLSRTAPGWLGFGGGSMTDKTFNRGGQDHHEGFFAVPFPFHEPVMQGFRQVARVYLLGAHLVYSFLAERCFGLRVLQARR